RALIRFPSFALPGSVGRMVADPHVSQRVEPAKDDAAARDECLQLGIAENLDLPLPLVDIGAGATELRVGSAGMTHQLARAFGQFLEDLLERVVRDALGVEAVVEAVRCPDPGGPKLPAGFVAGRAGGGRGDPA